MFLDTVHTETDSKRRGFLQKISPWYNRAGWLGVKLQFLYLLTLQKMQFHNIWRLLGTFIVKLRPKAGLIRPATTWSTFSALCSWPRQSGHLSCCLARNSANSRQKMSSHSAQSPHAYDFADSSCLSLDVNCCYETAIPCHLNCKVNSIHASRAVNSSWTGEWAVKSGVRILCEWEVLKFCERLVNLGIKPL